MGKGGRVKYLWRILPLDAHAEYGADIAVDPIGNVQRVYFAGVELRSVTNR